MSNLNLAVTYAPVDGFPAGASVAGIVATLTDASGVSVSQTVAVDAAAVVFADVAAGDYTFSVAAVDASGAVYGTAVPGSFSITAPATVSLSLPSAVVASQS